MCAWCFTEVRRESLKGDSGNNSNWVFLALILEDQEVDITRNLVSIKKMQENQMKCTKVSSSTQLQCWVEISMWRAVCFLGAVIKLYILSSLHYKINLSHPVAHRVVVWQNISFILGNFYPDFPPTIRCDLSETLETGGRTRQVLGRVRSPEGCFSSANPTSWIIVSHCGGEQP